MNYYEYTPGGGGGATGSSDVVIVGSITLPVSVGGVVTVSQSNIPSGIVTVSGNYGVTVNSGAVGASQVGTWNIGSVTTMPITTVTSSAVNPVFVAPSGGILAVSQSNTPAGTQSVTASFANPVCVTISGNLSASFTDTVSITSSAANPVFTAPSGGFTQVSQRPGAATVTRVAVSGGTVQLLPSTPARLGIVVVNESSGTMFLKYGTAATTGSYTYKISSNQILEVGSIYTGIIHAVLGSGTGNAQITELA